MHIRLYSVLNPTVIRPGWAIYGLLVDKNSLKGELSRAPHQRKVFDFFTCFEISIRNLVYTSIRHRTHQVRVSSKLGHPYLLYSLKFVFIYGLKYYIEPSDVVHTYISVLTHAAFRYDWAIFGPRVATSTQKKDLSRAPHQWQVSELFSTCFDIWTWNMVYTSSRWHGTTRLSFAEIRSLPQDSFPDLFSKCLDVSTWNLVYILSRLHNILSSRYTRMRSLWPTSCS